MKQFKHTYTTKEKKDKDAAKPEEERTGEADKTELSNDAFALGESITSVLNKLEQIRLQLK